MKIFILLLLTTMSFTFNTKAQIRSFSLINEMTTIKEDMIESVNDLPVNIRRATVYKLDYDSRTFSTEEITYIKAEVEDYFKSNTGVTIISPPELEPNNKLKIVGKDSTLTIMNVRGRSLADISSENLLAISNLYGIQGLIELAIEREYQEGLVLIIKIINPDSRELIWTRSFVSNPVKRKEQVDRGRINVIDIGIGIRETSSVIPSASGAATVVLAESIIDYNIRYTYRQPVNRKNKGYIGLTAGLHLLRSVAAPIFDSDLLSAGFTYFQPLSREIGNNGLYRFSGLLGIKAELPVGTRPQKGQLFLVEPGFLFGFSESLGLSIYAQYQLPGSQIVLDDGRELIFGELGYGVRGVFKF